MIRTIYFDFGNVVAEFNHGRALDRLAPFTDMPKMEMARALYINPLEDAYERGLISTAEYVLRAKSVARLNCTDDEFLAAYVDIFLPNSEVCELIPLLKPRYRLVLASNTNAAHYAKFTEQFAGVLGHFDALCPSFRVGHRKPEPAYFEYCQQFAEAEPGECLFIDDLAANVEGAMRHGWNGVVYEPGANIGEHLAGMGIQFHPVL